MTPSLISQNIRDVSLIYIEDKYFIENFIYSEIFLLFLLKNLSLLWAKYI